MVPNLVRPAPARGGRRRPRRPARLVLPVVVLGAAALVAGIVALAHGGGASSTAGPGGVTAYDTAIKAPVQHWGKIATLGMRPALGDLQSGQGVPAALIAGEARAWQTGLDQVRQQMRAAATPPSLRHAADLFDQSMQAYLHAAALFEQAASGAGDKPTLLRLGVDALSQADCVFDDAAVQVQAELRAAGAARDPDLPDATCSAG